MCSRFLLMSVISVIAITTTIDAQIPSFGPCPDVSVQSDFDGERYIGLWYSHEQYPFVFTLGGKCVTATYGLNSNGTISVMNSQFRSGTHNTISGYAKVQSPGKLGVIFPSLPFQVEAKYWVLGTDYDNYSVVYSCDDIGFLRGEVVWILTRQQFPVQDVVEKAHAILKTNNISTSYLRKVDQKNCN